MASGRCRRGPRGVVAVLEPVLVGVLVFVDVLGTGGGDGRTARDDAAVVDRAGRGVAVRRWSGRRQRRNHADGGGGVAGDGADGAALAAPARGSDVDDAFGGAFGHGLV